MKKQSKFLSLLLLTCPLVLLNHNPVLANETVTPSNENIIAESSQNNIIETQSPVGTEENVPTTIEKVDPIPEIPLAENTNPAPCSS